jgi:hypothetical protein
MLPAGEAAAELLTCITLQFTWHLAAGEETAITPMVMISRVKGLKFFMTIWIFEQ